MGSMPHSLWLREGRVKGVSPIGIAEAPLDSLHLAAGAFWWSFPLTSIAQPVALATREKPLYADEHSHTPVARTTSKPRSRTSEITVCSLYRNALHDEVSGLVGIGVEPEFEFR